MSGAFEATVLPGRSGLNPVFGVDGQGRATVIWITADTPLELPVDYRDLHVRGATLLPDRSGFSEMASNLSEKGVVGTFAHEVDTQTFFAPSPRITLAVTPGGRRYAAWVRTVDGVRRIEVAVSPGFSSPFGQPSTLFSACGSPSDLSHLQIAADDSGAHLVYIDKCVSSSSSKWRAVMIAEDGTLGTPYALSPETLSYSGTLVRTGGVSYFVSLNRSPGSPLNLYRLGATRVDETRAIVTNGSDVGGWHAAAHTPSNQVATVVRLFQGGEYKVMLEVGGITNSDSVVFDAIPGQSATSPSIAAGADSTFVAAWIEGGKVHVSTRKGVTWSVPVSVPEAPDPQPVPTQQSVRVAVSSSGVAQIVWAANQDDRDTVFAVAMDLNENPPRFSNLLSSSLYPVDWPSLAILPDGLGLVGMNETGHLMSIAVGAHVGFLPSLRKTSLPLISNLARPSIKGTARVGARLTAVKGTWQPTPLTYSYQWYAGKSAIKGATKNRLLLKTSHRGKKISVRETVRHPGYAAMIAASKSTAAVKAGRR